jgi:hypothetical protein
MTTTPPDAPPAPASVLDPRFLRRVRTNEGLFDPGKNRGLFDLGRRLRTQDAQFTAWPIYLVQQKRTVWGIDVDFDPPLIAWQPLDATDELHSEEEAWAILVADGVEPRAVSREVRAELLEAAGFTKIGGYSYWEYVTAHFTWDAADGYIEANRHRLTEPRVYVDSQYRCPEWQMVVNLLLKLTEET